MCIKKDKAMELNNDVSIKKSKSAGYLPPEEGPKKQKTEKAPFQKDSVEFKNEDQLEREKINKELEESQPPLEEKKPNKLKMFFNKFLGKKPNNEKNYNYENNPPPYDK